MKGTFFSADFVKDANDNLRLLEVNTDTAISSNNLKYLNFDELISVMETNNITKLTVVHKPDIHKRIVANLSESIQSNAPFITTFTEIKEGGSVIYPTSVTDEEDLFVLRMAYDESAIFDSEYAKGTLNTLRLFSDYNSGSLVPEFYHSSSAEGFYNTITHEFNPSNLPECVIKDISDVNHSFIEFYKIGSESESDTNESRWNEFISSQSSESNMIQKYHINSETISNNKVSSIRAYSIVYGPDLSLVHVGEFEESSPFELPTISIYDENLYVNTIDAKHYYEYATNIPKLGSSFDGILSTHLVIKSDDTEVELGNLEVGDLLKSYYIDGVNAANDDFTYTEWEMNGSELPSGSYVTSSAVIYKNTQDLTNKTLSNITVNNNEDSLFVATNKSFLVYDSGSDITSWKLAMEIIPENDYLLDYDGSIAPVTANEIFIVNEDGFGLVELDVEDTDTFIIAGTTAINSFVVHNAPCFVAGTEIILSNGDVKNIEDISVGDDVLTFNVKDNKLEPNVVKNVFSKQVDKTVKYVFENGITLQSTVDHPIYVIGKGWCSFEHEVSNKLYTLEESVQKIEINDVVKLNEGDVKLLEIHSIDETTTVYNLQEIENNHNFFANGVLVHNRKL